MAPAPKVHIPTRDELAQRDINKFFHELADTTDRKPEFHDPKWSTDHLLDLHPAIADRAAVRQLVRYAYIVAAEIWDTYHQEADQ